MGGSKRSMYLAFLALLSLVGEVPGLVTIPVPDDLLGPGKCPTGSFCIDTDYCTQEYYTTLSGMPFFCGPHHSIDSMICCLSIEPTVEVRESEKSTPILAPAPPSVDANISEDDVDIKRINRNHPNISLYLGESSDDENEADVLSMPFLAENEDEVPFDVPLPPNPNELDGQFRTLNDLESMVEEAINQELNAAKFRGGSPGHEDQAGTGSFADNNIPDAALPRPMETDNISGHKFTFDELPSHPMRFNMIDRQMKRANSIGNTVNELPEEENNFEGRSNHQRYPYQPIPACACERGSRGEPGPKGDPGEPGKIIYIPVFVNTESGTLPGFGPTGPSPYDNNIFTSPPRPYDFAGNLYQQQQRPARHNTAPPTPHQPQTVVPYQVPVQGLPTLSLTPSPPPQYPSKPFPQPQQQPPAPPSSPSPTPSQPINILQQLSQPPSPLSMEFAGDLQDRLSRHASEFRRHGRTHRAN